MNFISKIPGPLLIFFGAFCLSFGGLIVKSFEGSTLWQILFWRQVFFIIVVTIFLIATYKKEVFKKIYVSGIPGLIGGIILGIGFSSYVFAMYNTTVANTNFIIQTQTIFLAIFGYFFKRKNFKNYFSFYHFSNFWINFNARKYSIKWTNVWKYRCLCNANYLCISNFNCKKISSCGYGAPTISCRNSCNDNRFFSFNKNFYIFK